MRTPDSMLRGIVKSGIMGRLWLATLTGFLLFGNATAICAQEFPSQVAVREGYKEISKFREIFVPLWNNAYPAKDYSALFNAAPSIDSAANIIFKMVFKTRFGSRMSAFKDRKYALMKSASDYSKAATNGDSAAVYQLFPQIQSEFESTAVILLPLPYPHLERLIGKAKYLADSLIKKGDILELAKVTDSIISGVQRLSPDSLPSKAKDKADLATDEFAYFNTLSLRLKDALAAKDMEKYRLLAIELSVRLVNFQYKFLL